MLLSRETTETIQLARRRAGPVRVLFLQGPPSPFVREAGDELEARGAVVARVNLCLGDWLFWHDRRAVSFRGRASEWEGWLDAHVSRLGITDIVWFADRFPYHRAARRVARRRGLNAVAIEYGYLRPDWIVCEPFGQSGWSHLSRDPARLRAEAAALPPAQIEPRHSPSFLSEAVGETVYHLANGLDRALWPHFESDRATDPLREYSSYPLRFLRGRLARRHARRLIPRLGGTRFFLLPLQIEGDYQLRANSPFRNRREVLAHVLSSFARHAPGDTRLVVKRHPLDNGVGDWVRDVRDLADREGIDDRVDTLDGGDLPELSRMATGMVTVNSTSGLTALRERCPVVALGLAVYDIEGLTHQGTLDDFWQDHRPPDADLLDALLRVLAHRCHLRGTFHGRDGRRAGAEALARRLTSPEGWPTCFEDRLPRAGRAAQLGIALDD